MRAHGATGNRKAGAWPGPARTRGPGREIPGRSSWSRDGDDAIWFLGRGEAEACYHAVPADALLGPGGTANRPLSVYRVAVEPEPPGLAPVAENPQHQSRLGQLDLDGAT